MAVGTQEEFVERVRAAVQRVPEGEWITGGMWGAYDQWAIGSAGGEAREPFRPDMSKSKLREKMQWHTAWEWM